MGFFSLSVVDTLIEQMVHMYLNNPRCCCTKLPTVHVHCLVPRLPIRGVCGSEKGGRDLGLLLWFL